MPESRDVRADADRSPLAEMTGRHRREALALQQKMLECLRRLDADDLKPAEVIRWFDVAVRVEKEAMGAREDAEEGGRRRELIEALLADPDALELACQLAEKLASGGVVASGVGVVGDAPHVALGEAPGDA
jgi:hypothetical protein